MQIRNVTRQQADQIAKDLQIRTIDAYSLSPRVTGVCLRVDASQPRDANKNLPFQKLSRGAPWKDGRRTCAVCWHGHYAFLERIFELNASAIVITCLPGHGGRVRLTADNWEDLANRSASVNVGSQMYPANAEDCCEHARQEHDARMYLALVAPV